MKSKKCLSLLVSFLCFSGCLEGLNSSVVYAELVLKVHKEGSLYVNNDGGFKTVYLLDDKKHVAYLTGAWGENTTWKFPTKVVKSEQIDSGENKKSSNNKKNKEYNVVKIQESAFVYCKNVYIIFDEAKYVEVIKPHALWGCLPKNISELNLNGLENLTNIGCGAFAGNNIQEVRMEKLKKHIYIGHYAFSTDEKAEKTLKIYCNGNARGNISNISGCGKFKSIDTIFVDTKNNSIEKTNEVVPPVNKNEVVIPINEEEISKNNKKILFKSSKSQET